RAAEGHSSVPDVGSPRPAIMRSAVDLPQPDGPSRLTNSPWATSIDMFCSATVPFENTFETPRSETSRLRADSCRATAGLAVSEVGVGTVTFMSSKNYRMTNGPARCAGPRRRSSFGPLFLQVHAELLADELGRVHLRDIEAGFDRARFHH